MCSVLGLLWLCGPAAAGRPKAPPAPDEDRDEADMEAIKAALREQTPPGTGRPPPPSPGLPMLVRIYEALPSFSGAAELRLGYRRPDATPGPGNAVSAELGLDKALDPYLRLSAYATIDRQGAGLLEARAATLFLPRVRIEAGLLLHRFGRVHARHPHELLLTAPPLLLGRVFADAWPRGRLGGEASFLLPLPWYCELSAAALEHPLPAGIVPAPADAWTPLDLLYVLTLKQAARLPRGGSVALGLSGAFFANATGRGNRTDVYGVDFMFRLGPLHLEGEWAWRRRQVPGALFDDVTGYAEAAAAPRGVLLLAARYEYGSGSGAPDEAEFLQDRHRLAAGAALQPSRFARVRLDGLVDFLPAGPGYGGYLTLHLFLGTHRTLD